MANIIIIEKETKFAEDMSRHFTDSNSNHRVRVFENETLFFNAYLKKIKKVEEPPRISTSKEGLRLSDDQRAWINAANLNPDLPWEQSTPSLAFTSDSDEFKILHILPVQAALGHSCDEFIEDPNLLETMIAGPFKASWEDFKSYLLRHERVKAILCIEDQGKSWIIGVKGLTDEKGCRFEFKNMTEIFIDQVKEEKIFIDKEKMNQSKGTEETELLYTVDLVLFRTNCISERLEEWIPNTLQTLKEKELWPEEDLAPKFVPFKFDDDGTSSEKLEIPGISDLIILPLDRLLFLQKMDIVLNFPSKIRPKYLFSQDVHMGIEISKRSRILKISDIALAIRNPVPLRAGTSAHLYFDFPDCEELLDVYGRVCHSEADPEHENQYHIYFSYFGTPKATISILRLYLSKSSTYKPLVADNPDRFLPPEEDDAFVDRKTVAIVDLDSKNLKSMEAIIKENSKEIEVITETSYFMFAKRYLEQTNLNSSPRQEVPAATEDDIFANPLVWFIDSDENLMKVLDKPIAQDMILGAPSTGYFSLPQAWKKLFTDPDTEEMLKEAILAAKSWQEVTRPMDLTNSEGNLFSMNVAVAPSGDGQEIRIEISVIEEPEEISGQIGQLAIENLDLLIIDSAFISEDVDAWVCSIQNTAYLAGRTKKPLPILVMENKEESDTLVPLLSSGAYGLVNKPLDSRVLMYHVGLATQAPYHKFVFSNIGWAGVSLTAFLARRAVLAELSEFGGCIILPKAIQPGSFLNLHGSIYTEAAPGGFLPARFYFSERNPEDRREILCHFIYFGITDGFLKFTRNWIRDRYAAQKAQA